MLAARGIPAYPEKLWSEIEGDIENEGGVIVIKRLRVKYHIKIPRGKRPEAERAVATHERKCPAATSVRNCIEIRYEADIIEE
ncbi:MAG: OsmC family protein [Acidobacteria bacterium]|nr:OsmC family protein [Acidobacteriota bacterium]